MSLRRRALLSGGLGAAALAAAGCTPGRRDPSVLTAVDVHRDGYPTVAAVKWMAGELERETGGRLSIRHYHSGQLGSEDDSIGLARFGAIDFCRVNMASLNNAFPATRILSLPYVFRDVGHLHRALDGDVGRDILKSFERRGLVGLAFYDAGARCFYNSRRPVRRPGDLRGLKIRVPNSDIFLRTVGAMGANSTPLGFGATFSALQTHLIDGAENNWPSFESTRHFEVAQHWAETEHSFSPEALLVSKATLNALAPRDRELIADLARRSVPLMRRLWAATEAEARAKVTAAGVQVHSVDKAAFAQAVQPVLRRYLQDETLAGLHRRITGLA